jgi:demethylmenaquinone methyltransferase/2-methoxy-6-polyprenyl-1,4-benzoquinol methylase
VNNEAADRGPDAEKIRSMFGEIASSYDRANTILSGGVHHLWRKRLVKWSGAYKGQRILDCATGTGDLALEFKSAVGPTGVVIGTDFCAEMLANAPEKALMRTLEVKFETADVTNLPYETASFDVSSISFGIRNVENPVKALRELARVVRPGGSVMILEFGQPSMPVIRHAYDIYSRYVLPKIGGLITGQANAYEYLQNSSSQFPCAEKFTQLMRESSAFSRCEFKPLTFGVSYMYKGIVNDT